MLRFSTGVALVVSLLLLGSCAVPLGPGYTIEKQTLDVHFVAQPQPHLEIRAWYRIMNTGNEPLSSLEVRLPDAKSYDVENLQTLWDGREIALQGSTGAPDDKQTIPMEPPWPQKQRHELTISYGISHSVHESTKVPIAVEDAFYLPPTGWYPELQSPKGTFAKLGSPPKKWDFSVRVPQDFVAHASGREHGSKKTSGEREHRFEQRPGDFLPFIIAGHYQEQEVRSLQQTVVFWTRQPLQHDSANKVGQSAAKAMQFLDSAFGPRGNGSRPFWVVECPFKAIPESSRNETGSWNGVRVCQPLPEVALINLDVFKLEPDSLIEALSPSWIGLGLSPDIATLAAPMNMLQVYAAVAALEGQQGPGARNKDLSGMIQIYSMSYKGDKAIEKKGRNGADYRKSLFFFFALEDQFGRDHLHHAIARMIHARRGRGYDLDDLHSALEAETGQSVAQFFHHWFDKPGIPEDFRLRYAQPNPSTTDKPKEKQP